MTNAPGSALERNLKDFVRVYDNVLESDFCDHIVAKFEQDSAYHTGPGGVPPDRAHEDSISHWTELNIQELDHWYDVLVRLKDITVESSERYSMDCKVWFPTQARLENYRIKRYMPAAGDRFHPHVDIDCLAHIKRFLVMFWYLTDVEDGGETYFPDIDLGVKPAKGRMLLFPPYWMFPHEGRPPVSGTKFILGTYLNFAE